MIASQVENKIITIIIIPFELFRGEGGGGEGAEGIHKYSLLTQFFCLFFSSFSGIIYFFQLLQRGTRPGCSWAVLFSSFLV